MTLPFRKQLLSLFLSLMGGVLAGAFTTIFLHLLQKATATRLEQPWLLFFLPAGGFALGWVYLRWGRAGEKGLSLVFQEVERPRRPLPLLLAPFILAGTLLTHLLGGSAGRESTAVQMGAAAADLAGRRFRISRAMRSRLLTAGISAGFASALGTPLAGALFGMEVVRKSGMRTFAWRECLAASFAAYYASVFLGAPHSLFPIPPPPSFSGLLWAAPAGILFGLAALAFAHTVQFVKAAASRISYLPLRTALGGALVVLLFLALGSQRYAGLGLPVIEEALRGNATTLDPFFKALATAVTVGSGFKGGEFIPLVFTGSTLGVLLSSFLPLEASQLALLGFGALFGAASKTPLASALMLCELFGWSHGPQALLCCYIAYLFSGWAGIYPGQKPGRKGRWKKWAGKKIR